MHELSDIATDPVNTTDHPLHPDRLITQLHWRYATKKFDPRRKIGSDVWVALEESLRMAPSSGAIATVEVHHRDRCGYPRETPAGLLQSGTGH